MTGYMEVLYELSGAVLYSDQVTKILLQEWHMWGMSDIMINVGISCLVSIFRVPTRHNIRLSVEMILT